MKRSLPYSLIACLLLAACSLGCSVMQAWKAKSDASDVATMREQRRGEAVQNFDRRRAAAHLLKAQEHAERGDIEGAERVLQGILARDPGNVDARLYLAELYWACEDLSEAETQLREALTTAEDRADVHHLLGIVLDAQDRTDEAHDHLRKAVDLEPNNELFRMALDTATESF